MCNIIPSTKPEGMSLCRGDTLGPPWSFRCIREHNANLMSSLPISHWKWCYALVQHQNIHHITFPCHCLVAWCQGTGTQSALIIHWHPLLSVQQKSKSYHDMEVYLAWESWDRVIILAVLIPWCDLDDLLRNFLDWWYQSRLNVLNHISTQSRPPKWLTENIRIIKNKIKIIKHNLLRRTGGAPSFQSSCSMSQHTDLGCGGWKLQIQKPKTFWISKTTIDSLLCCGDYMWKLAHFKCTVGCMEILPHGAIL